MQVLGHADKYSDLVLAHNTCVSITVLDSHVLLKIRGTKNAFPRVIEQVCWVVSVAGKTSISLLEKYIKETGTGTTTRGYAETLHTGKPVINAGSDGRFKVSFSPPRTESHQNHGFVAKSGHCWKTMAGLSIVASGYAIPQRLRQGSGLEAPLSVLRQLFKRGCPGKPVLPLDKPLVMIATKTGNNQAYQLRLILAAGAQQCTQGNDIYWHFDPAKLCDSMESCEQLEKEIRVNSLMIQPRSRHFVGWSSEAGILAGKQPNYSSDGRLHWPPGQATGSHMQRLPTCKVPAAPIDVALQSWRGLPQLTSNITPPCHSTSSPSHISLPQPPASSVSVRCPVPIDGPQRLFDVLCSFLKSTRRHTDSQSLQGTPKTDPNVSKSKLRVLPHSELVVPSINASIRFPAVLSLGASLGAEKVENPLKKKDMAAQRFQRRSMLRVCYFILWDTLDGRGWLVNGQAVALHILRANLKLHLETKSFDFSKLDHINDETSLGTELLLQKLEDEEYDVVEKVNNDGQDAEGGGPSKDKTDVKKKTLGDFLDGIYSTLLDMPEATEKLYQHKQLTGSLREWFDERWSHTVKGWDFEDIHKNPKADVHVKKFRKDPGWLHLVRDLKPTFLFGRNFGEIMQPRDGHCCPYFKILPKGHDYLAVGLHTIQTLVHEEGAAPKPTETVAKLSPQIAWEHDVDPFSHLLGQGDHLDKINPSCFPVQRLVRIHDNYEHVEKDKDLLKKRKVRLYSWIEVDKMNSASGETKEGLEKYKSNKGLVVFGNKPDAAKLRQLAQSNLQRNGSSGRPQTASATTFATTKEQTQSGTTQRPSSSNSSRSNTSVSDAKGARPPTNGPTQASVSPARRAPSVSSVRSTSSSTHFKSSNGPGAERPQASNPQASAAPAHTAASNASLRSTDSRSKATGVGSVESHVSPAPATTPIAMRKASNSSVRTTSSTASQAMGRSNAQAPAGQPSTAGLKKTATNSSDKTTSSRSSKNTQNSTAGSTAAENRQRQQRLEQQLGATTAAAGNLAASQPTGSNHGASSSGTTANSHPTSSGPAPTGGKGSDGSS